MFTMVQKWLRASLFAAAGVLAVVLSFGATTSAEDKKTDKKGEKEPTIKEIMVKGHKGADAYLSKIGASAKGGKWEDAQEAAKGLAYFGETLVKLEPAKGDKKSWEPLAKQYADETKAVLKATEDKDAKATAAALGAIGKSCMPCHKAHKGK